MDKETYEALKRLIGVIENMTWLTKRDENDLKQINKLIDETAKEKNIGTNLPTINLYKNMEKYNVWLKENEEQLEKDYELDIDEAMKLKDTADYGNDNWKNIEPFNKYCHSRYNTELEDKKEDKKN